MAVNGEIYNHQALRAEFADYQFQTGSDCEVILPLMRKGDIVDGLNRLSGIFAFAFTTATTTRSSSPATR